MTEAGNKIKGATEKHHAARKKRHEHAHHKHKEKQEKIQSPVDASGIASIGDSVTVGEQAKPA